MGILKFYPLSKHPVTLTKKTSWVTTWKFYSLGQHPVTFTVRLNATVIRFSIR